MGIDISPGILLILAPALLTVIAIPLLLKREGLLWLASMLIVCGIETIKPRK